MQSDVWAVGVLLFEMLALRRPFDGVNILNTAILVTQGTPCPNAAKALLGSGHPEGLLELVGTGPGCLLCKNPEKRALLEDISRRFPLPTDDSWRKLLGKLEKVSSRTSIGPLGINSLLSQSSTVEASVASVSSSGSSVGHASGMDEWADAIAKKAQEARFSGSARPRGSFKGSLWGQLER